MVSASCWRERVGTADPGDHGVHFVKDSEELPAGIVILSDSIEQFLQARHRTDGLADDHLRDRFRHDP